MPTVHGRTGAQAHGAGPAADDTGGGQRDSGTWR
jgi:hypothetical protein